MVMLVVGVELELNTWIGYFIINGRRGGVACSVYFLWRFIIGRNVGVSFGGACFLGGDLCGPIFPAQLPPLTLLVDTWVSALPISVAAQRGNCCQPCMLLDQVSG